MYVCCQCLEDLHWIASVPQERQLVESSLNCQTIDKKASQSREANSQKEVQSAVAPVKAE